MELDLSSLESVRNFVSNFTEESDKNNWPKLYCAVLNAGVVPVLGHSLKMGMRRRLQ